MIISAKLVVMRFVVVAWRADRARRRKLYQELATFVTPSDRAELDAMLSRHTAEESRELRAILNQQAWIRQSASLPKSMLDR